MKVQVVNEPKIIEQQPIERGRVLHSSDILPSTIQQRHIQEGLIIFRGLKADRPSTGDTEKQVYFAEDEKKLYIWNTVSEAWESATYA